MAKERRSPLEYSVCLGLGPDWTECCCKSDHSKYEPTTRCFKFIQNYTQTIPQHYLPLDFTGCLTICVVRSKSFTVLWSPICWVCMHAPSKDLLISRGTSIILQHEWVKETDLELPTFSASIWIKVTIRDSRHSKGKACTVTSLFVFSSRHIGLHCTSAIHWNAAEWKELWQIPAVWWPVMCERYWKSAEGGSTVHFNQLRWPSQCWEKYSDQCHPGRWVSFLTLQIGFSPFTKLTWCTLHIHKAL